MFRRLLGPLPWGLSKPGRGRLRVWIGRWLRFTTGLFVSSLFAAGLGRAQARGASGEDPAGTAVRIRTCEGRGFVRGSRGPAPDGTRPSSQRIVKGP